MQFAHEKYIIFVILYVYALVRTTIAYDIKNRIKTLKSKKKHKNMLF